jgi:hypothetical protein
MDGHAAATECNGEESIRWETSGGGVEGDGVSEGVQFPEVLTDLAFGVGAGGVVVGAEVDELRFVVG